MRVRESPQPRGHLALLSAATLGAVAFLSLGQIGVAKDGDDDSLTRRTEVLADEVRSGVPDRQLPAFRELHQVLRMRRSNLALEAAESQVEAESGPVRCEAMLILLEFGNIDALAPAVLARALRRKYPPEMPLAMEAVRTLVRADALAATDSEWAEWIADRGALGRQAVSLLAGGPSVLGPRGIDALLGVAIDGETATIRTAATSGVVRRARLLRRSSIPRLLSALTQSPESVQVEGLSALADLGQFALGASDWVRERVASPNPTVADAAAESLARIRPGADTVSLLVDRAKGMRGSVSIGLIRAIKCSGARNADVAPIVGELPRGASEWERLEFATLRED